MALSPIPNRVSITKSFKDHLINAEWIRWLRELVAAVDASAKNLGTAALTAQAGSIAATPVATQRLNAGTYRVSWYARITQAATVSSSLTVSIRWTDGGILNTLSGVPITGNTTATNQSGEALVNIDDGTTIDYAATYASVGATPMQYALTVVIEKVA